MTGWLQDELAKSVTTEQGKTFQDAKGDVFRGLGEQGAAGVACSWLVDECDRQELWQERERTGAAAPPR